ncbi:Ricin B lectin [Catenulispora acidiphila DSM 44928]|uniref:Ricin B lectin n=1 Tax=Catenulispora acidiphila (strain DSM 44928 / JCM 14897 / NBRC 102108 / NRRL B-24433 / ID139908) TaxID=479433 RepID=C7Q7G3_CATAD|nr:Ricin B lectin [Catenulispora acidiphila DSM 44928]
MEPALRIRVSTAGFGALVLTAGLLTFGQVAAAPKAHAADPVGPITGYQGLCLDDRSASTANFNPVQVYTCNGSSAQSWTVGSAGNTLQVLGKCLDVNAAGTANGTAVDLYDCNGSGAQVWVPQSNGELLNPNSGKCLDDTGFGGSGTQVQIWACADSANQQWAVPTGGGGGGGGGGGIPHPDFGPNVTVFDPSMSTSTIQGDINSVYNSQVNNEFGTQRNALLFAPGSYNVDIPVGYNTEVAGLGLSPDAVNITGGTVHVAGHTADGNATQNFWRDAENMEVSPPSGSTMWAVSQADPFRRMDVKGSMLLYDNIHGSGGNWSSGGYVGDSRISGQINSGTQQQFLTQNTAMNGGWTGSNWNMVFVGDTNAPANTFPNPPDTTVAQTPVNREKPFIYVDASGTWQVFVPALRTNAQGPDWTNGTPAGTSIPVSQFYIVKPGDTSATINAALSAGKSLIVTPGVYHLSSALNITSPNTVVLGLGLATLVPDNGNAAITTADVDGIDIAGLLISANSTNSAVMMQIGPNGSTASHAANPTELQDVFFRIGGDQVGKATQALVVNSNNVIGDDLWLWRADHTNGVGWTVNPAQNGLVVNGNNVTMYGLAVEHFEKYQTEWFGNGGRTYFYQSETPYDVPNQGSWVPPNGATGYASYLVGPSVTSHQAWGLGVYAYFPVNPSMVLDHAIETPTTSGVAFHDMVTTVLGGDGTLNHQVNETGGQVTPSHNASYLVSYP